MFVSPRRVARAAFRLIVPSALALCAFPCAALAQSRIVDRLALHGEGAFAVVLSNFQRNELGYDLGFQGSARLAFNVIDPLAIQATYSTWLLPSPLGLGQQTLVGGGLRFEPRVSRIGRMFIDGNVGAGFTGPYTRVMFDAGLGFEFDVTNWFAFGPVVRYAHLFTTDQDVRSDSKVFSVGLAITLRVPRAETQPTARPVVTPPPPSHAPQGEPVRSDRDGDGISDRDDTCPDEVPGDHPDPLRPGCRLDDSDNDGVFDNVDQCVTTAAGPHPDPQRAGCPDADEDGDGVTNHLDECQLIPQGIHPDAEHPGCPAADRDGDSVPDATDHCPDRAGAPNPDPLRNGCPGLVVIRDGAIHIAQPVFFASGRERILPRSNRVLTAIADVLRAMPEIRRMSVEGHTDDRGDDDVNMRLSQRRADSVMAWFVAHGIDATRLEAHGLGETHPIADNRHASGRAENRRVEFRITDPASDSPAEGAR